MKEGEKGASMFLIAAGEVEVNKSLTMKFAEDDFRETEKTLTVLTSADNAVFGEMALVSEDLRSATITNHHRLHPLRDQPQKFSGPGRQPAGPGF